MTKKDYELIARVLKDQLESCFTHVNKQIGTIEAYSVECVVKQLTKELEQDNPRFNRQKFMKACGLDS